MEQQKLPNATIAIILSILGFVCCCIGGLPGIILGGISLLLLKKDENKYKANPELYSNYNMVKTAKVISIIVLILGVLYLVYSIYQIQAAGGWEAHMERSRELMEQWGIEE